MNAEKIEWWTNIRLKINKGLVVAGIILIPVLAYPIYSLLEGNKTGMLIGFGIALFFYLLYIGTVNLLSIFIEFVDRQFNKGFESLVRKKYYNVFFWLFVCPPILFILWSFYLRKL